MKKSILVLSALLTLVVSGVCLQSCSSEYDEYTTEEYGYYTEEEIAAIEAMAEKYGLNLRMDENYYGEKLSLSEFEKEFKSILSIKGEYEMIPIKDTNGTVTCTSRKKGEMIERSSTRAAESWSGSDNSTKYSVSVVVKWDFSKRLRDEILTAKGTLSYGIASISDELSNNFIGENIEFYGSISGSLYGSLISVVIDNGIVYNYPAGGLRGKFDVVL